MLENNVYWDEKYGEGHFTHTLLRLGVLECFMLCRRMHTHVWFRMAKVTDCQVGSRAWRQSQRCSWRRKRGSLIHRAARSTSPRNGPVATRSNRDSLCSRRSSINSLCASDAWSVWQVVTAPFFTKVRFEIDTFVSEEEGTAEPTLMFYVAAPAIFFPFDVATDLSCHDLFQFSNAFIRRDFGDFC